MDEEAISQLLGRPLTATEEDNFQLYLDIAKERLESLTCLNLTEETADRVYSVRKGYTTVFTDLFDTLNSATIDGEGVNVTAMQWNKRNADWYNLVVLDELTNDTEITINADWGFYSNELQLLLARLFNVISLEQNGNGRIRSKSIEDYSVTYKDTTVFDQFMLDNASLINKYSICHIGQVSHGAVC